MAYYHMSVLLNSHLSLHYTERVHVQVAATQAQLVGEGSLAQIVRFNQSAS